MLELNAYDWPIGAQRKLIGPLDNHYTRLSQHIFQAQRFEIVKIANPI